MTRRRSFLNASVRFEAAAPPACCHIVSEGWPLARRLGDSVVLEVKRHNRRFEWHGGGHLSCYSAWKTVRAADPNGKVFTRIVCVRLVSSRNCYPETDDKNASVDMASIWAVNRLSSSFNDASCVSSVPLQTASVKMMAR